MDKFLVLNFEDAKLFRTHRGTKDKVLCISSGDNLGINRVDVPQFTEPIVVNQISNILHVLFGERPTPSNRVTVYNKIDYYYEKAMNSYLRIDTYKTPNGKFPTETILLNKAQYNSFNKTINANWERVRRLLDDEIFKYFTSTLNEILGFDVLSKTLYEVKEIILNTKDSRLDELFKYLKVNKKTSLYSFIYDPKSVAVLNQNMYNGNAVTVINGPEKVNVLHGQILVPIDDNDLIKLKQNRGCATLLDGGLVYIDGIKNGSSINPDGFRKMSEISLEKKLYNEN